MDDPVEELQSLKLLNSLLVRETLDRRKQAESVIRAKDALESELTRYRAELSKTSECVVRLEMEKRVVHAYVRAQMLQFETAKFERYDEIGALKEEVSNLEIDLRNERDQLRRVREERGAVKIASGHLLEEANGSRMEVIEIEESEREIVEEVEILKMETDSLESRETNNSGEKLNLKSAVGSGKDCEDVQEDEGDIRFEKDPSLSRVVRRKRSARRCKNHVWPSLDQPNGCTAVKQDGGTANGNTSVPYSCDQASWICCPFCRWKHQYLQWYVNKTLRCGNCRLSFRPIDLSSRASTKINPSAMKSNTRAGKKQKVQHDQGSNVKPRSDFGASGSNSSAKAVKKHKAQHGKVKDNQGGSVNKKRQWKSDEKDVTGVGVMVCADPEFSDFDKDKDCFAVNQVWAMYDDSVDAMPRNYARITKVFSTEFKLQITWFDPNPDDNDEIHWNNAELPIACGSYSLSITQVTVASLHKFSHLVRSLNRGPKGVYSMHPSKGETWAVFKNWDIGWSSDVEKHLPFEYEYVEILSDFVEGAGILVSYLDKVKGFVCLFQLRKNDDGVSSFKIPDSELYRFSHQVPSFRMSGEERRGVPKGSFELDPAALPPNINDLNHVKMET